MALNSASERRRHTRIRKTFPQTLRLTLQDHPGGAQMEIVTRIVDISESGCCVDLAIAIPVGTIALLDGQIVRASKPGLWTARVMWCRLNSQANFSAGLQLEAPADPRFSANRTDPEFGSKPLPDYYDELQLSTKADPDTIQRVYRLLAQRYHPDNPDSGSEEAFKRLLEAYKVLSDPEKRAAYDVGHLAHARVRWKIFQQPNAAQGKQAERRRRQGILAVLYTRRLNEPAQPSMTVSELEDLLAVPREHLEFSLWYLKEKSWIIRGDNGKHTITAAGVEQAETDELSAPPQDRLLTSACE